jgi:hypothetical protein
MDVYSPFNVDKFNETLLENLLFVLMKINKYCLVIDYINTNPISENLGESDNYREDMRKTLEPIMDK